MQALIDKALPMARLLWEREIAGQVFDSPERRAALDQRLRALLARLLDRSLREHYAEEFRRLRRELFADTAGPFRWAPRGKARAPSAPLPTTRGSVLAAAPSEAVEEELREAMILALLFAHPGLIARFEDDLWRLESGLEAHRTLAGVLLDAARHSPLPDPTALEATAGAALASLRAHPHLTRSPLLAASADPERVALCLAEDFAILSARRAAREELAEAMRDLETQPGEGLTWRLAQASAARDRAGRGVGAPTDLGEDRESLSNHLQSLIDSQVWVRKRRSGPT
jgi:DNA primase